MDRESRAEAKRRYKEEVHPKGIYCIRCAESKSVWIDSSRNLPGSENRLQFSLKTGMHLNKDLQTALKSFGATAFQFEVLEIFDQELSTYELDKQLKERRKHWQETLSGQSLHR